MGLTSRKRISCLTWAAWCAFLAAFSLVLWFVIDWAGDHGLRSGIRLLVFSVALAAHISAGFLALQKRKSIQESSLANAGDAH